MGYAGRTKYDEPGKAAEYRARSPRRDEEEWALLARLIDGLAEPPATAWDVPCGTGRVAERLLDRGIVTWCGDLSPAMRAETETRLAGRKGFRGARHFDLEDPGLGPFETTDLVVCMRFLHHLPDRVHRLRVLRTLRRICGGHVLLSFHHPVSFHNAQRLLRRLFTGRSGDRHTLTPRSLRSEAGEAGLEVLGLHALAAYRRELWVAVLRPVGTAPELVPPEGALPEPST